ncbi:MAG: GWxTD domain-containing protein [Bacteroidales bacterium]|nr:GWxTD domain-containing protein [Bacteroidales bacterium]
MRFKTENEGLYFFYTDSTKENGFTLLCKDSLFPNQSTAVQMLEPLIYLNREINIDSLKNSQIGSKLELDKFWYFLANQNIEIAKEIIRVFYNRVYLSNIYFTDYKEGLKTDKGMIFIILGLPNSIRYKKNNEEWIYENRYEPENNVSFIFENNETVNLNNSWLLKRNESYRRIWNEAIKSWKKGQVFNYYNYNQYSNE